MIVRSAYIKIQCGEKMASTIELALAPEAKEEMPRCDVHIDREAGDLILDFNADDTSSLRAALNSYLRWVEVAMSTSEEINK